MGSSIEEVEAAEENSECNIEICGEGDRSYARFIVKVKLGPQGPSQSGLKELCLRLQLTKRVRPRNILNSSSES